MPHMHTDFQNHSGDFDHETLAILGILDSAEDTRNEFREYDAETERLLESFTAETDRILAEFCDDLGDVAADLEELF
jgi:hypothetical protein